MTNLVGLKIIGYFCWWTINQVKIARATFQALINAAGFKLELPEACFRTAFLQAVREVAAANKNRFLIRKIFKNSDEYAFGLVDEKVDKNTLHLGYSHKATMLFNPQSGALACDQPHAAFDQIKTRYEDYKDNLTADNVRATVIDLLASMRTVSVRQRGGIYFVPEQHRAEVEMLEKLIASIPGDCFLAVAPQIDTEKSKVAIYKAFVEDLKNRIKNFQVEVENDVLHKKSSWENRLGDFKKLKEEISFYKDAMAFSADDISKELENLTAKVREKIVG